MNYLCIISSGNGVYLVNYSEKLIEEAKRAEWKVMVMGLANDRFPEGPIANLVDIFPNFKFTIGEFDGY